MVCSLTFVSGYSYVITIAQSALQILCLLLTHEYIGYLLIQIAGGIWEQLDNGDCGLIVDATMVGL